MIITENEVLDALRTAMQTVESGEGSTVAELREELGWGEEWTRTAIKKLIRDGVMECVRGRRVAMDGRRMMVPVYRFVAAPPKKKR